MSQYRTDGAAQVALPGGGQVSVAFLADRGVPGYSARPDGTYAVPTDAHFRTLDGGAVPVADYGFAVGGSTAPSSSTPAEDGAFDGSASGSVRNVLIQQRLEELIPEVDGWIRAGMTWPEIEAMLRDPTTKAGKVVDRIYPEIQLRLKQGKEPVSIAQIQEFRQSARAIMRAARMPEGFYDDPSDFTRFIVDDVELQEIQERVNGYVEAAVTAPAETLMAMQQLYNVGPEGLAAYWMAPDRALAVLQKQARAASTAGTAVRSGFGQLSAEEAERLASVGVTGDAAASGFGTLVQAAELFQGLPGSVDGAVGRDDQLGLISGDAKTAERLRRRAEARTAETQGGGGYATAKDGFAGFGSAR